LKYLRSLTLKCKDIGIRKSEFVTKTQFLYNTISIANILEFGILITWKEIIVYVIKRTIDTC